jgi:hypothetical protein
LWFAHLARSSSAGGQASARAALVPDASGKAGYSQPPLNPARSRFASIGRRTVSPVTFGGQRIGWQQHDTSRPGEITRCLRALLDDAEFFIRDRKVLGLIPSRAAAPSGPWIRSLSSSVTIARRGSPPPDPGSTRRPARARSAAPGCCRARHAPAGPGSPASPPGAASPACAGTAREST